MKATAGDELDIDSAVNNINGTIVADGGTVSVDGKIIDSGSFGAVIINADSTLKLLGEGSVIGNVDFAGVGATLFLDFSGSQISGAIVGATTTDSIDDAIVSFVSGVHTAWQQNGSCPYRKSNPDVLMVQSSQERLGNDAANGLDRPRNRRILAQR